PAARYCIGCGAPAGRSRTCCAARNGCADIAGDPRSPRRGPSVARQVPEEVAMASKRILLIDDEVNARSALKTLLGDEGYEIREAKDGEEALAMIAVFWPV